jgi:ketosteroid isomerase-like protein
MIMFAQQLPKLAICLFCCLPMLSNAQQKSSDGEKILALEKKWTESYKQRDIAILSSLLADDFVITIEDGSTFGKLGYISHSAESSVHVDVADLSELRVRIHGNTAVVTGAYHETGLSKGKHYEYRDRLTDVWMKVDGKWQVIASHYSVPVNQ